MSQIQVAQIRTCTEAEGPGRRMAIWVQGCPLRCPACCNPEMLAFGGGETWAISELAEEAVRSAEQHGVQGVTLLGGEPFAHSGPLADFVDSVRQSLPLSVMTFTGFTLREIRDTLDADSERLLAATDILVDGPFDPELPDTQRRWIGSTNQEIHFLTDRYQADDPCWEESNTLEIQWQDGVLSVNGFPAPRAVGFWRRPGQQQS